MADVAAPDHVGAGSNQAGCQARRLGVVEQHDVAGPHPRTDLGGIVPERLLVDLALGLAEIRSVPGRTVEGVVQPLRDLEELLVPFDHDPAGVDTDAA